MSRTVSLEAVLYLIVAVLAAWLRLGHLDHSPLSDSEAAAALPATDSTLASGPLAAPSAFSLAPERPAASSAAYRVLTAAVFAVFGAQEATARWVPALAGVLLVLTPLLVRREFGTGPAFMTAALLAISPTLWTASRTAGGASLAVLGVVAAVFFLVRARGEPRLNLELAGAAAGLAAVTGPSGLTGAITLGAGWVAFTLLKRRQSNPHALSSPFPIGIAPGTSWRAALIAAVAMVAVATGFGFFPTGLRAVFDGLGTWAAGWFQRGGQPAGTVLLQLPAYEPLVLVFGGLGLAAGLRKGSGFAPWLASWAIGALAVLLIHPSRRPSDVLWVVIPLTLLAAPVIADRLTRLVEARPAWVTLGAGAGVLALIGFSYLQLRGYAGSLEAAQVFLGVPVLLGLAVMGLLLALTALSLVAAGWSNELALRVAAGVGLLTLLALSISAGAALNAPRPSPSEIWRPQTSTDGLLTLRKSLRTLSEAEVGRPHALPIQFGDPPTAALAWLLRDDPRYRSLQPDDAPPVILVREGGELPGEYLGQSLSIGEQRVWPGAYPPQLLSWWLTRSGPTAEQRWVLLVRQDVAGVEQLQERPPAEQLQERPPSGQLQERPPSGQLQERPPAEQLEQ